MSTIQDRETPAERLARIQSGFSQNDLAAIYAFANCGIDPEEIAPRVNVLTFNAWKAKGRKVAKGAIGQPVTVWISKSGKKGDDTPEATEDGKRSGGCYPKTTYLFHESQTIPADAPKGTPPAAVGNVNLIRTMPKRRKTASKGQIAMINEHNAHQVDVMWKEPDGR